MTGEGRDVDGRGAAAGGAPDERGRAAHGASAPSAGTAPDAAQDAPATVRETAQDAPATVRETAQDAPATVRETIWEGLPAQVLENGLVSVTVVPSMGGHVASLVDVAAGRELLWRNPRLTPRLAPYGAWFDDWWSGGWDEIFPGGDLSTLHGEKLPYMGELWCLPWAASASSAPDGAEAWITTTALGNVAAARFTRRLALRAGQPVLWASYRIENLDVQPLPFTWGVHPAFAVGPDHRIDLPENGGMTVGVASGPLMGAVEQRYAWPSLPVGGSAAPSPRHDERAPFARPGGGDATLAPAGGRDDPLVPAGLDDSALARPGGGVATLAPAGAEDSPVGPAGEDDARYAPDGVRDMARVLPREAGVFGGHWATDLADGWLALTDIAARRGVAIVFDPSVFPHAWLWQVYGGWRGHQLLALEPWTSHPQDIAGAVDAGRARVLAPGERLETWVAFALHEGLERVTAVERRPEGLTVR